MKKVKESVFVCSNCGNEYSKWMGQCVACKEWNSIKEVRGLGSKGGKVKRLESEVKKITEGQSEICFLSKIPEFDRVLGKGLVQGQVILFAGEPGIGKSTLLTQIMGINTGLYVAGEESADQIGLRVKRLKLKAENYDILETNSIEEIEAKVSRTKNQYKIVVVDSIQMMVTDEKSNGVGAWTAGSPGQIRESTFKLVELAKREKVVIIIVGHVTKEGEIAGPKLLEHMVDTVLYFEGDKNSDLRILRCVKNRFGPTDEVGIFKMEETGLRGIGTDEINLVNNNEEKVGSAITILIEGTRPMMVEIQALVTESYSQMPKRIFSGVDFNRGQLLVAVMQKVLGIPMYQNDVFVMVTGGLKIDDTGVDLAVVAAMYSSYKNKVLGKKVWVGEVSLLGEVREVRQYEKRIKEVKALGREMAEINNIRELK
ncbi:MAG TPA: DNA repair protein RadA [Candidatus Woesebacteria bacterium]|nr:DNA repair protein RadA [Candidatus Woesebacteria bacterium]